ncbi:hypothetical protein [Anaerosporobacter sp.]|uniref:hypothetical protein n=1 Tax=Anaerosporobacter sp. TaxID=1872529 RepID=UPI00286EFA1B|nr:hypothetical protein [Anaerosporobacter sp.]
MKDYLPTIFKSPTKEFVNRTEIRNIIMQECEQKIQKKNYFKTIAIYGIGGIGKTRLIEKIKETIQNSSYKRKIIHISFEIDKNQQSLDNLIKIRKAFLKSCPIFDYALLVYWDKNHSEVLNKDFMNHLKNNFFTNSCDILIENSELLSGVVPGLEILSKTPSVSSIFENVNKIINIINNTEHRKLIENIPSMPDSELINLMPIYLGYDIRRYMEKNPEEYTIFIFDSYYQSQPYSESQEWLLKLIGTIRHGLFIVTSREKLQWLDNNDDMYIYQLKSFPEDAARELLEHYISKKESELIDSIIDSTECVPIYINLAIEVYKKEYSNNPEVIVKKSLFQDRNLLVNQFINHMNSQWQETLLSLSVIRVFNQDIFNHLIKEQGLSCPVTDYYDIINVSLINYIENSEELIKLHDVFSKNGACVLKLNARLHIFRIYLKYLAKRTFYVNDTLSLTSKITLFLNILTLEEEFSKETTLEISDWELTLDIFFELYDMKASFSPPKPCSLYADDFNDILYLINSIHHKSISTLESIKQFESVKTPKIFGKHEKSYLLLMKYAISLLGEYDEWYLLLLELKEQLTQEDEGQWYDIRIKLYLIDYWIMDGSFKEACQSLIELKDKLPYSYFSAENVLHIFRYMGHLYRFNLFCEKAILSYKEVLTKLQESHMINVYIQTNLFETNCYFNPEYIDEHFDETLNWAQKLKHKKNIGKLYYSRAIARIVKGNFSGALEDINESLNINQQDGYKSGELFAYMAQSYLNYAQNGYVLPETEIVIESLLEQNHVYEFFRLPLFLMANDINNAEKMRIKYKWLDFDYTVAQYNKFLTIIRPQR